VVEPFPYVYAPSWLARVASSDVRSVRMSMV
jgi:hypothetical protein